jgi:hypothetical protein
MRIEKKKKRKNESKETRELSVFNTLDIVKKISTR